MKLTPWTENEEENFIQKVSRGDYRYTGSAYQYKKMFKFLHEYSKLAHFGRSYEIDGLFSMSKLGIKKVIDYYKLIGLTEPFLSIVLKLKKLEKKARSAKTRLDKVEVIDAFASIEHCNGYILPFAFGIEDEVADKWVQKMLNWLATKANPNRRAKRGAS